MRRSSRRPKKPKNRSQAQPGRRRRTKAEIKEHKKKIRKKQDALRAEMAKAMAQATNPALPNRVSQHTRVEDEAADREENVVRYLDTLRTQLSVLLKSLSAIKDFRNPKKIEHQLSLALFYGVLCFVFHTQSRRAANRQLTGPVLLEHLRQLLPELEKLPHQDTLNRILSGIDVEDIANIHLEMIKRLIKNKKFNRWLIHGCYPIAIDGTQKHTSRDELSPEWLARRINAGKDNEFTQYFVYVLEASLVFANGLRLPLMSEFLNYAEGDTDNSKQDCELKAFHRMAERLKTAFPNLQIMLLLDGLYPNGPVFETCRNKEWQFMIVLQDGSLPSIWEEYRGLRRLEVNNRFQQNWGDRKQRFEWVNAIDYYFGEKQRKKQTVHLVVCMEEWTEIDKETGKEVTKTSRHAWLSSEPLNQSNIHERCNLGARHRWGIETNILVEKRQGYQYEHRFSSDWNAMKGYHYLMHIGHALNALARYSESLAKVVKEKGVRGFIEYIRESLVTPWLDPETLFKRLNPKPQLRLV